MFDIQEYYQNSQPLSAEQEVLDLEIDINTDIDNLLNSRPYILYQADRFKSHKRNIDIIYPKLTYPGARAILNTPDKIRFILSFYPYKEDFNKISKIILLPRYIEVNNIELVSLYLRRKKIIVMYMSYPHNYTMDNPEFDPQSEFIPTDLGKLTNTIITPDKTGSKRKINVHPLWHILSTISCNNDDKIDKFFIKRQPHNDRLARSLIKISYFFSERGY